MPWRPPWLLLQQAEMRIGCWGGREVEVTSSVAGDHRVADEPRGYIIISVSLAPAMQGGR